MFHRLISTDGQFIALKLISSPYCAVSGFVYEFCSVSCKTSQNVAFRIYLHEVNSKFMSTAIIDAKIYVSFFLVYHLMKTFTAVKINDAVGKSI